MNVLGQYGMFFSKWLKYVGMSYDLSEESVLLNKVHCNPEHIVNLFVLIIVM